MPVQTHGSLVTDLNGLDDAFTCSHQEPVLLFLDDPYCPISRRAAAEVASIDAPVRRVDVSRQHELSRAIEERTGVPHASPQFFVLTNGQPAWTASHRRITAEAIQQALTALERER